MVNDFIGEITTCTECGLRKEIVFHRKAWTTQDGTYVPTRLLCKDCVKKKNKT